MVSLLPTGAAARPHRPLGPRLGAAGEAAWWSETPVAFARLRLRAIETAIAFAGGDRASTETAIAFAGTGLASTETVIAFAGEKWVFLACFSGAEVMPVSAVPCWGRAVVLLVSTSPRCRANRPCPGLVGDVAHEAGCGGGFAALEAGWRRVVGVSYL